MISRDEECNSPCSLHALIEFTWLILVARCWIALCEISEKFTGKNIAVTSNAHQKVSWTRKRWIMSESEDKPYHCRCYIRIRATHNPQQPRAKLYWFFSVKRKWMIILIKKGNDPKNMLALSQLGKIRHLICINRIYTKHRKYAITQLVILIFVKLERFKKFLILCFDI